jgi:hypothetical protein
MDHNYPPDVLPGETPQTYFARKYPGRAPPRLRTGPIENWPQYAVWWTGMLSGLLLTGHATMDDDRNETAPSGP